MVDDEEHIRKRCLFDPFTQDYDVHANALVPHGAQVGHPLTDSKLLQQVSWQCLA